jgi:hypothetical protein
MTLSLAVLGTTLIVIAVCLLFVLGVAWALYTRSGSGVDTHPIRDRRAPGAEDRGETGGEPGQGSATGTDAEGSSDPQHGTR